MPAFVIASQQCEKSPVTDSTLGNYRFSAQFFASPRRKAFAAALIALIMLTAIWWAGHLWYRNRLLVEARGDVMASLDPYGNALTIDLRRRFDLIFGLRAWVTTRSSMADLSASFKSFARQLSEGVTGVRNLNIAPGGVVRLVYPQAGNDAIVGRDLLNDSRADVREEVARAIKSRTMVVSNPLN